MRKYKKRRQHSSRHHIIPTSRGGTDEPANIIELDIKIHRAWHILFSNYLVEEVIDLLKHRWRTKDGNVSRTFLRSENKREAWKTLFGNANADNAVEIIINEIVTKKSSKWAQ